MITREQIRRIAGYSFYRGEELYRQRKIRKFEVKRNGEQDTITADVRGSGGNVYDVSITLERDTGLVEESWKKEQTDRKKTETERIERIKRLEPWLRLLTAAAGIGLAVYFYQGITVRHSVLETVLYRFTVPVTIWAAVSGTRLPEAREWMKYGFFLYTIHFILARGINKAAAMFLPHTAAAALLVYLVIPAVCVITAWKLGAFLKKYTGPFWRLINGGR